MSSRRFEGLDGSRAMAHADWVRLAAAKEREEERWRRARSIGIIGTVLLHFLLLILFRQVDIPPPTPQAAAGPPAGDIRAAAGGSGLTMIEVRPARPPTVEETPVPVLIPTPVEPELPDEVEITPTVSEPAPAAPSLPGETAPGEGGDEGAAAGPGNDAGEGEGGGGSGDGGVATIIPPKPRGIFIPPAGHPSSARGQEITIWVFVTELGRVQRNSIRLEPPTSDSRYNQRLIQNVAEWVFDPARQEGRPVSAWYPFQIEFY